MSSQRINAVEKDLEKFIKFLALKSTQVVVQSRLGEKIQTKCNPLSGNDWFNIVVEDHPDVYAETKRVLALGPGESILQRLPLCIEISLKTAEGDQMVLEVWSLDLQSPNQQKQRDKDEKTDAIKGENTKGGAAGGACTNANSSASEQQTLKAAHAIYNRMGILLKSLISLTRATPAYKLSRRQCPDSYGIYYRIYVDRPQVHTLGEGHKLVRIGQLNTIVGVLNMSVAYRTKMTITPTTASQARTKDCNDIMIDSNHFRPADGMAGVGNALKKGGGGVAVERKIIDIEKPLRPGAFTDIGKIRQYTEEDFVLPETPPFEWLLRKPRHESASSGGTGCYGSIESLNRKSDSPVSSPVGHGSQNSTNINNNNTNAPNNNNLATFKNTENSEKVQKSPTHSTHSQSPIKSLLIPVPPTTRHSSAPNLPPTHPTLSADDNLLKELNFPFASPTSHVSDLAKFYRDCYHAPPLRGLSELQTDAEKTTEGCDTNSPSVAATNGSSTNAIVDDLSRQLEQFETSLEDFDKLVTQLGLTASSSTGSRSSGGLQMSN